RSLQKWGWRLRVLVDADRHPQVPLLVPAGGRPQGGDGVHPFPEPPLLAMGELPLDPLDSPGVSDLEAKESLRIVVLAPCLPILSLPHCKSSLWSASTTALGITALQNRPSLLY